METHDDQSGLKRKSNLDMDPERRAKKRKRGRKEPQITEGENQGFTDVGGIELNNKDALEDLKTAGAIATEQAGMGQPPNQKDAGKKRRKRKGQGHQKDPKKVSDDTTDQAQAANGTKQHELPTIDQHATSTEPSPAVVNQNAQTSNNNSELIIEGHDGPEPAKHRQRPKKRRNRGKPFDKERWEVSEPIGGKFIDADPLFARDEKRLILATENATTVYSTLDSLLLQSLPNGSSGRTVAYCLSSVDPQILYVATEKSHVLKWNMVDGHRLGRWVVNGNIQCIQAVQMSNSDVDTLFIVDQSHKGWRIAAHRFGSSSDPAVTDLAALIELPKPVRSLKIVGNGRVIVGITTDGLLLGSSESSSGEHLKSLKFSWHQVKCVEMPTCFDVRLATITHSGSNAKEKAKHSTNKTVDVVVGGMKGSIYLYRNILNRLTQSIQNSKNKDPPKIVPSQMHWHREAVGAVAWSRDGNYIISGGMETVLVLWQLETGRKQFLPHLESAVRNIVISPDGSSYAVKLGDNSAIVLSTTELTPTANVVGLQTMGFIPGAMQAPILATVESIAQEPSLESYHSVACAVNPANPNQLFAAVPAYQTDANVAAGPVSAPYLQVFDVNSSRHVTRQALTRVNATSSNIGPEGNRVLEPDVKLVKVSSDGQWLATIDEWVTPKLDSQDITFGTHGNRQTKDVQLKFWSWNSDAQEWMLNTRIATPHQKEGSPLCESILDVAVYPSANRFATLGTDSLVRVWKPRRSRAKGQVVNGQSNSNHKTPSINSLETWWSLDYSVALPSSLVLESHELLASRRGKLSFSADGSILATYQRFDRDGHNGRDIIHFVDTEHRSVHHSRGNFFHGQGIHDFGFLDKYLICVGREKLCVWDATTFEMRFDISLSTLLSSSGQKADQNNPRADSKPFTRLAIDFSSNTFAIAVPELAKKIRYSQTNSLLNYTTQIYVFSPSTLPKVLFGTKLPHAALALMPAGGRANVDGDVDGLATSHKGYLLLDATACIRKIRPNTSTPGGSILKQQDPDDLTETSSGMQLTGVESRLSLVPATGEETADMEDDTQEEVGEHAWESLFAQTEDKRPVVRTQELANAFDYPSHAMPSMNDLFKSVLSLYAGKA